MRNVSPDQLKQLLKALGAESPELLQVITKSLPDVSQTYVNRPMTRYAFSFMQNDGAFFSDKVFPNLTVDDQTGIFWTIPKGTFTRDEMRMRADMARAREIDWSLGNDTYRVDPWALRLPIPDRLMRFNQLPFSVQQFATRMLMQQARMRRDRAFAAAFLTTGVWGRDIAGNTSASVDGTSVRQWSDPASTPLQDIAALSTLFQLDTEGTRPNRLLLGRQVWDALKNHPQILDRLNRGQTSGPAQITLADVAGLFELERIVIADTIVNTANEGQAVTDSFIVGKIGLLYYATDTPQMMEPTAGLTLSWKGIGDGSANDFGVNIEQYRLPDIKATWFETNMGFGHKKVSAAHGTFLNTLVA